MNTIKTHVGRYLRSRFLWPSVRFASVLDFWRLSLKTTYPFLDSYYFMALEFSLSLITCFQSFTFFYNVFRATRYKTTSLPAALNQARRIDTLLWIYIVMHLISFSLLLLFCLYPGKCVRIWFVHLSV